MKIPEELRFRTGLSSPWNGCDLSESTRFRDGLDGKQAGVREPEARVDSFVPGWTHMMQPEIESLVHE